MIYTAAERDEAKSRKYQIEKTEMLKRYGIKT
jgi:hypothetical protein